MLKTEIPPALIPGVPNSYPQHRHSCFRFDPLLDQQCQHSINNIDRNVQKSQSFLSSVEQCLTASLIPSPLSTSSPRNHANIIIDKPPLLRQQQEYKHHQQQQELNCFDINHPPLYDDDGYPMDGGDVIMPKPFLLLSSSFPVDGHQHSFQLRHFMERGTTQKSFYDKPDDHQQQQNECELLNLRDDAPDFDKCWWLRRWQQQWCHYDPLPPPPPPQFLLPPPLIALGNNHHLQKQQQQTKQRRKEMTTKTNAPSCSLPLKLFDDLNKVAETLEQQQPNTATAAKESSLETIEYAVSDPLPSYLPTLNPFVALQKQQKQNLQKHLSEEMDTQRQSVVVADASEIVYSGQNCDSTKYLIDLNGEICSENNNWSAEKCMENGIGDEVPSPAATEPLADRTKTNFDNQFQTIMDSQPQRQQEEHLAMASLLQSGQPPLVAVQVPNEPIIVKTTAAHSRSKVIMLGNSGVGKTSLIYNVRYGTGLVQTEATIGATYLNFNLSFRADSLKLQIWDTAGQERFRSMVPLYMRNAYAAILVYDITDRSSFDDLDKWHREVQRASNMDDPIFVLIGNKADQHEFREVAEGEGISKAHRLNARFYEISAFDTQVIRSIFYDLAAEIAERLDQVEDAEEASEEFFARHYATVPMKVETTNAATEKCQYNMRHKFIDFLLCIHTYI